MSTSTATSQHTSTGTTTSPQLAQLPDDTATLKRMILELLATLQQERQDKEALRQRIDVLLRRLYGPRSERFDPSQPFLFGDTNQPPDSAPAETATTDAPAQASESMSTQPRRRCRPHGRQRLPDNLQRRSVHYELTEAERVCACGHVRVDIGVEVSEQLDYQPASLFIWKHHIHKYACPHCAKQAASGAAPVEATPVEAVTPPVDTMAEQSEAATDTSTTTAEQSEAATSIATTQPSPAVVIAASKPAMPIDKGLPGAGLLAHVIVSKYMDHLPLYRLERIYERQGIFLSRSTTCDWLAACAELLQPLYDLMVACVLQSRAVHTDDTPVKVQDPKPGGMTTGRLWTYLGDAQHPYNVFDFTLTHKRDGPQKFLANYHGYLQADAFSGYDALYLPKLSDGLPRIVEAACNAHARRKFHEARGTDLMRAHQALAYYGQLYEIERQAKDADESQRLRMRQDLAVPILERFHAWLEGQRAEVLPKSPMGEAIYYALHNWTALVRYTEAGFLAIDNNVAEREMKQIAIGRKNWLFVGSEQGGHTAAVLLSFTSTCRRLGVEPWAYLRDVLTRLPTTPAAQLAELLPDRWQAARAAQSPVPAADAAP
jgi:transposase